MGFLGIKLLTDIEFESKFGLLCGLSEGVIVSIPVYSLGRMTPRKTGRDLLVPRPTSRKVRGGARHE